MPPSSSPLHVLCVLLLLAIVSHTRAISWIPDSVSVSSTVTARSNGHSVNVTLSANGPIADDSVGHFRVQYQFIQYGFELLSGISDCISFTASAVSAKSLLRQSHLKNNVSGSTTSTLDDYFTIYTQKYFDNFNLTTKSRTSMVFGLIPRDKNLTRVHFSLSVSGCATARTFGFWNDRHRWNESRVPQSTDSVFFPPKSGIIQLESDVSVKRITVESGTIVSQSSGCMPGWTVDDRSALTNKCYKFVNVPMSYGNANQFCNSMTGGGSATRQLVRISDQSELNLVYRLCRPTNMEGCWIGLSDFYGQKLFQWEVDTRIDYSNISPLFLDFRRFQPDNMTVNNNVEALGGERCVATAPWMNDPLILEQGGWNDESCTNKKRFICQSSMTTQKYSIHVQSRFSATGGQLYGGTIDLGSSHADIISFELFASATVKSLPSSVLVIGKLNMTDSCHLFANGATTLTGGSIGEINEHLDFAQSVVEFGSDSSTIVRGNVTLASRVNSYGNLSIASGVTMDLKQGGLLSQTLVSLQSSTSALTLSGYASRLSAFDSFDLILSHRGPTVGEFYNNNVTQEESSAVHGTQKGVYRIVVQSGTSKQVTQCIPYNASSDKLKNILSRLSLVANRGGVTIRSYGNQNNPHFGYGFHHRIDFDSPSTNHFMLGPLSFDIQCYGFACGCAETLVKLESSTGIDLCPIPANFSHVSTDTCLVVPDISILRITTLSALKSLGAGNIIVRGGVHRLMPIATVNVVVSSGTALVSADKIIWKSVYVETNGLLLLTGTGWSGWDSSSLLLAPDWEQRRGLVSVLSSAPAFSMNCQSVSVDGLGQILTTGPNSALTWKDVSWRGGVIGGLSTVVIINSFLLLGNIKMLRYGITLLVNDTARAVWSAGNISLANGAKLIVRGSLTVSNSQSETAVAIGEAHLLGSSSNLNYLHEEPGRSWQSYYDRTLDSELRPGWYGNPICLDKCLNVNELIVEGNGELVAGMNSSSLFLLPVNIVGFNYLSIGKFAQVNMGSGGVFGDNVVVDLSIGTTLELSGGQLLMEAKCTIQGAGELIVSAGSHDLAFSVDAHITISGGTLLWPESRGTQQTITFNGGLLLQGTGLLEVQPFSTTILIHKEVHIKDQSMIQFPLIGIAAQASPFDRADAPDSSPRGNLTATGTMRWEGGTLKGKADFNALHELFLDGDSKYIMSLAKLVNKGHCEWGKGNIVSSDNGDFQNFGTVQMLVSDGESMSEALYKGSELPIDNGGDVFALEYHSWDADNGALGYSEYLLLRTRFVSKVPNGWTFDSQSN